MHTWYDKAVFGTLEFIEDIVRPINKFAYKHRERKVSIRIDNYDVWNADHTLALIIAPTLKKLKEQNHGYGMVDDEDVPEELRRKPKTDTDDLSDEDNVSEARWNHIMDEMIFAFECHANDDDDYQFSHNFDQLEMKMDDNKITFNHQKDPNKPAYWVDYDARKLHNERKANGRRLFAKYYESLWD